MRYRSDNSGTAPDVSVHLATMPLSTQNVVIIDEDNHPSVHVEESVSIDSDTSAGSYDISTTGNTINSEGISPIYSISPPVSNICRAPLYI